ncbi:MAG: hypothetical protein JNM78_14710 [Cyclobacteriaceae bacterium]|nr:hypothetical protein [Cyclobacteriaceae bacterium]
MKRSYFIMLVIVCMQCHSKGNHDPSYSLDPNRQAEILFKSIRYSAKLPPTSNHDNKFDTTFDSYYKRAAADYSFINLSKSKDGSYAFLISRPAKSITPMFEGIGGRFKLDENDSLIVYDEVFRTWKMPFNDLVERGGFLYSRMINGEDLTLFYSINAGDKYIEFPDDRFTFDKKLRRWKDHVFDSIQIN